MASSKKTPSRPKAPAAGKTKSKSAPRKKPAPAPEKQRGSGRELFGLFLLCLGVLSGIYSFFPSRNMATDVLQGLAGRLCFLVPLILLWIGALVTFSSASRKLNPRRITLISLLVALVFAFVHLIGIEESFYQVRVRNWLNYALYCYDEQAGAGFLGAALSYPLFLTVGRVGGMVVLVFLAIGDLVLLRVISLQKIGSAAQKMARKRAEDMREKRDEWRTGRDERRKEKEAARKEALYVEKIAPLSPGPSDADAPAGRRRVPSQAVSADATVFEPDKGAEEGIFEPVARGRKARVLDKKKDEEAPKSAEPVDVFVDIVPPEEISETGSDEDSPDFVGYADGVTAEESQAEEPAQPDAEIQHDTEEPEDDNPAFESESDDLIERTSPFVTAGRRGAPREMEIVPDRPQPQDPGERMDGSPLKAPEVEPRIEEEEFEEYNYPPVDLLAPAKPSQAAMHKQSDIEKSRKLAETLQSFGIAAKLVGIAHGPAVTRFELLPAPGVKVSKITALADDIALSLAALNIRIEAPIPGKSAVGVEVPNDEVEIVPLREVLESNEARKHPSRLAVALGKDNSGRYIVADLAKMPHLLIAGATGSGKSVCINDFICSILYRATPEEVRLIMIDPKMVELSVYNGIPHLLTPVVTDPKKAAGALNWAVAEMTQRYKMFADKGVRDMKGYNLSLTEEEKPMPQIVVIIDELADLMMVCPGEVEDSICRLAQLARAAGIHLVIATQRPSVNVITGIIKANIPSRIAFTVASQVDSRTILDVGGAEKLLGRGDMLFAPAGTTKPTRVQGAWVSDKEVASVVEYIKERHDAEYDPDIIEHMNRTDEEEEPETAEESGEVDELLQQAIEMSVESGQASISMLQRRLRVGYARAGRLIDDMAARGIVSQSEGAKPRTVLITRDQYRQMFGDMT